jgi:hypothetical protein
MRIDARIGVTGVESPGEAGDGKSVFHRQREHRQAAGSGRVPAGFNNIVGLKPTKGWFSARGVVPACRRLATVKASSTVSANTDRVSFSRQAGTTPRAENQPLALGTDTAGSGRVPAGFNNIVGLKPTKGWFSARGVEHRQGVIQPAGWHHAAGREPAFGRFQTDNIVKPGGSGRVPAGFNNIVGLKPTKGWFSARGVVPACRLNDVDERAGWPGPYAD